MEKPYSKAPELLAACRTVLFQLDTLVRLRRIEPDYPAIVLLRKVVLDALPEGVAPNLPEPLPPDWQKRTEAD